MSVLRLAIITLLVLLCVAVSVQFFLAQSELRVWPEPSQGFAVDVAPQYAIRLYHFLSFLLLIIVVFAKRYFWALGTAVVYFFLDISATYARLATGFLGGDMCPEGHPCFRAIRRATWFDWTSVVLLLPTVILISVALYASARRRERTQ